MKIAVMVIIGAFSSEDKETIARIARTCTLSIKGVIEAISDIQQQTEKSTRSTKEMAASLRSVIEKMEIKKSSKTTLFQIGQNKEQRRLRNKHLRKSGW